MTYHQYWVRCKARDRLQHRLDSEGIDSGVYYDPPLHHHPLMEYCRMASDLKVAEVAGREMLTLPIHAALPFETADRIGSLVGEFLDAGRTRPPTDHCRARAGWRRATRCMRRHDASRRRRLTP